VLLDGQTPAFHGGVRACVGGILTM
jgi:hypothetical protein